MVVGVSQAPRTDVPPRSWNVPLIVDTRHSGVVRMICIAHSGLVHSVAQGHAMQVMVEGDRGAFGAWPISELVRILMLGRNRENFIFNKANFAVEYG